jgi:hypothetical protein
MKKQDLMLAAGREVKGAWRVLLLAVADLLKNP